MFDQNLLYLTIGGIAGFIIGVGLTSLFYKLFGLRLRERQLREQNKELKERLKAKDELIKKALRSVKEEAGSN